MFDKITHNIAIVAAKKLLHINQSENVSAAKCSLSIVAGIYILQRGIRTLQKHPLMSLQETFMGAFLIYDGVSNIRNIYPQKPKDITQVRRNQIQGNDPNSYAPAFV